ncbi:AraC family transcriptional regulator [Paenibacillus sp. UNC499MF]|uniref:AraC family transcriptional regulator n=1 Tax=Paenibacillus sp. UNC499MF TaxID=1502751 RepID=UPI0008A03587|nr:AraC family transcriptional regulator [Paenibacillus sp. UNC499MF]SEG56712.1 AraC-like ligand binding domain-containing protein [Paenibacillus sp. UNC499MF]
MSLMESFTKPIEALFNTSRIPAGFHSHLYYEIYYFHSGQCSYLVGDRIYNLSPGDLLLMNGMTLHYPKINPAYEYCRTIVHFDPAFAEGLFRAPLLTPVLNPFKKVDNRLISLESGEREKLEPMLEQLCSLSGKNDIISRDRFLVAFMQVLLQVYEIADKPRNRNHEPGGPRQQHVQQLISYVETHYSEDLTLDDMAEAVHLNKHYLVKMFKETTGITLFHYLYRRRINQAKVLFTLEPEKSITETAYEVGFKHLSHFSQTFKKFTGLTADEYRKQVLYTYPKL